MENLLRPHVAGIAPLASLIVDFLWVSPPVQCATCQRFYGYNSIRRHERTCMVIRPPGRYRQFCLRCMRTYTPAYYPRHRCIRARPVLAGEL